MVDGYIPLVLNDDFPVRELFSVHYFEYTSDYFYGGECHDFWEFCYVDKGEINVTSGDKEQVLGKSQMIFHKPGEFHALCANGKVAPNLVVASFSCGSPKMAWFENRVVKVGSTGRQLLAQIIDEAGAALLSPVGDPELKQLVRNVSAPPGAEQMMRIGLESLLILLYREGQGSPAGREDSNYIRDSFRQQSIDSVLAYMERNIEKKLTLEDICKDNIVGRSYLQKAFRERTGGGAMEYFGRLKIEAAKRMIREGRHNFTEISNHLGYNSIHYFSRHFKKVSGMTPSEYA